MSERFSISKEDLTKVGKGALIAGAGAVLTYLSSAITGLDFGVYTPIVVSAFGILVNFLRKFIPEN
jgi:hypothetical protein